MRYRFEVIATSQHDADFTPIRLEFWSVLEALAAERAYHNLGYFVTINPMTPFAYLSAN